MNTTKLTVLLVEDEPLLQKIHSMMLVKLNCHVDIADSGEEALSKANNTYDLIFMDVGLPGVNGIEAIQQIRHSNFQSKHTPIVVLTAYDSEEVKNECLAAGADAVFTKPIPREKLREILQEKKLF